MHGSCEEIKTKVFTQNTKTRMAGWVCRAQARNSSTTAPTCCQQPSKLRGNKEGCSSHEGTSMPMRQKGCNERGVHREGTQPEAAAGESRHACGRGAGQEAPGPAVTAASPTSRHGRRHSGDMGARGHMRTRHGQKSGKRGRGLPFTRSSACSCNNCCCRISNCLCSSSNCRLMYSWRHGQQGSKEKEREGKRDSISQEEGE